MRHLFLVHSNLTHLLARRVVEYEGIEPEDVALLVRRRYRPDERRFRVVHLPIYKGVRKPLPKRFGLLYGRRRLRAVDGLLYEITEGHPFHFYVPHTLKRFERVVLSHPSCAGFSFLEEGLAAYRTREELGRIVPRVATSRTQRIAYRGRLGEREFYRAGNTKAYGLSSWSFPDVEGRVVFDDLFRDAYSGDLSSIENVLVFDNASVTGKIRLETVLRCVDRALTKLSGEGMKSLHYKFHPAQAGSDEIERLESLLAGYAPQIHCQRLPDDAVLEGIAQAAPRVSFHQNVSSVGLYAAFAGCSVRSFAGYVIEAEPRFRRVYESQPGIYHELVELLE